VNRENNGLSPPGAVTPANDVNASPVKDSGLVLASSSPRRRQLLGYLGLEFEVMPSDFEEVVDESLTPAEVVVDLAIAKAQEIAARIVASTRGASVVLGADTVVVLDGRVIGKPASRQQAAEMLTQLSGRCHEVYTGVALVELPGGRVTSAHQVSKVYMRTIAPGEIRAYVETGEPMDKAGAYALQGIGSVFVEKIEGCFTNIIGLPIPLVVQLLRGCGFEILGWPL